MFRARADKIVAAPDEKICGYLFFSTKKKKRNRTNSVFVTIFNHLTATHKKNITNHIIYCQMQHTNTKIRCKKSFFYKIKIHKTHSKKNKFSPIQSLFFKHNIHNFAATLHNFSHTYAAENYYRKVWLPPPPPYSFSHLRKCDDNTLSSSSSSSRTNGATNIAANLTTSQTEFQLSLRHW